MYKRVGWYIKSQNFEGNHGTTVMKILYLWRSGYKSDISYAF